MGSFFYHFRIVVIILLLLGVSFVCCVFSAKVFSLKKLIVFFLKCFFFLKKLFFLNILLQISLQTKKADKTN